MNSLCSRGKKRDALDLHIDDNTKMLAAVAMATSMSSGCQTDDAQPRLFEAQHAMVRMPLYQLSHDTSKHSKRADN